MKGVSEKELKHHTRRLSIKEGIFWSVRASFGDNYVVPFAIAMGTSSPLAVILNSLWELKQVSQIFGSKLMEKFNRKSILTSSVAVDAFGWLFMALLGILYLNGVSSTILSYLVIFDLALILFSGGLGHPSWFSLIGDVVDGKFRGKWFSKRNTIISFVTILLTVLASFFLEHLREIGSEFNGFILFFFLAFVSRFYCVFILKKHYDKKVKGGTISLYPFKKFLKEKSNFKTFTVFRGLFAFAVGLSSSLVSIYLLRYLEMDYISYIMISLSGTFFSILSLNLWGRIADTYGNYKVILITTIFIPLTPILWILSTSKIYLFFVPAILGGTTWSAFILASGNFIYDNISREKRARAISYFSLFSGAGAFLGGIASSILMEFLNVSWIEPIYLIFIFGAVLRMVVVSLFVSKLREVKSKKNIKKSKKFSYTIAREVKPVLVEDLHEIASIKNYLSED